MFKKLIIPLILISLACVGVYWFVIKDSSSTPEPMIQGATEEADTSKVPTPADSSNLEGKLYEVIRKYPGLKVGVSVEDINNDNTANISEGYGFIAASTTKVLTATYTYNQAEQGNINLDDILVPKVQKPADYKPISFRENIKWMIVNSDNESWQDLMEYFGKSNYQAYVNNLGYSSFKTDGNIISANDMAGFLKQLNNEELIKGANLAELIGFMGQSWTGPLELNSAYQEIPKKTGWLEDRMHFVGITGSANNQKSFGIYTETTDGSVIDYDYSTSLINELLDVIASQQV